MLVWTFKTEVIIVVNVKYVLAEFGHNLSICTKDLRRNCKSLRLLVYGENLFSSALNNRCVFRIGERNHTTPNKGFGYRCRWFRRRTMRRERRRRLIGRGQNTG